MPPESKNEKLKKVVKALKLAMTLDDIELIRSTIEQVIDLLEEKSTKNGY